MLRKIYLLSMLSISPGIVVIRLAVIFDLKMAVVLYDVLWNTAEVIFLPFNYFSLNLTVKCVVIADFCGSSPFWLSLLLRRTVATPQLLVCLVHSLSAFLY